MVRLSLQLALRSGREGLLRLLITAAAVAVGVALLLGVLAEFHAFQANASQPCWSCTQGAAVPRTLPSHGDLWNKKILYAAVALTLIVAGCSLAVTVGGGLVDRKRPFTLLRVSGTPVGVLSRVVLLEAAVPLVAATVVAAGIAYGTSVMAVLRLAPAGTAIPQLGRDYYTIMGIGLAVAFGVITLTLPLLRTMTAPSTIRFE